MDGGTIYISSAINHLRIFHLEGWSFSLINSSLYIKNIYSPFVTEMSGKFLLWSVGFSIGFTYDYDGFIIFAKIFKIFKHKPIFLAIFLKWKNNFIKKTNVVATVKEFHVCTILCFLEKKIHFLK